MEGKVIDDLFKELDSSVLDPTTPYSHSVELRYVKRCCISILVPILLEGELNFTLEPELMDKTCEALARNFIPSHIERLWYRLEANLHTNKRAAIFYGLVILLASKIPEIREKSREIVRFLMECDFMREARRPSYFNVMLFVLGDSHTAKREFKGAIQGLFEFKNEVNLECVLQAISIVADFINDKDKEEDRAIIGVASKLLAYFVLHCQHHLSVLLYMYEKLGPIGLLPECDALPTDQLAFQVYKIIEELLGCSSSSSNQLENSQLVMQLAICHQGYNASKQTLICCFLVKLLMANTKQNQLVIEIVMAIEDMQPRARIWFDLPLFDRLVNIVEEYPDIDAKKGVLTAIEYWVYKKTIAGKIDDYGLVKVFSADSSNTEVQLGCGLCLLRLFNYDFYPRRSSDYSSALSRLPKRRTDMPPELHKLYDQLIQMIDRSLVASHIALTLT